MADVFYSVGQNTTDHKTGSPTITIASGVATFSVAQTDNAMGVGDRITHAGGDTLCYISGKTSTTVWPVVSATGGTPTDVTDQSVTSVAHEYTSLSAAEAGASDASHINNTDLTAAGASVILNIPCYFDSGADATAVDINVGTTDATYYVKVYTPDDTSTECNSSQRNDGTGLQNGYRLTQSANYNALLSVSQDFTRIEGLEFECTGSNSSRAFDFNTNSDEVRLEKCYIHTTNTADTSPNAIEISSTGTSVHHIINNFMFDPSGTAALGSGIQSSVYNTSRTYYIYNNTILNYGRSGSEAGLRITDDATYFLRNNIIQDCNLDYVLGGGSITSSANISSDTSSPETGLRSKTLTFVDKANDDYHLASSDNAAIDAATDLDPAVDAGAFTFSDDFDGDSRPDGSWDIGADDGAVEVMVFQNTDQAMTGGLEPASGGLQ